LNIALAALTVLAVVSGGLVTQLLNNELAQLEVFATLKLGDSQLTPGGPLLVSSNLTADLTQPPPQPIPQRIAPDDDCLFNPALPKCAPIAGKCPPGFLMNEEEQCFPDKPCPPGFSKHDEDETGTCYSISSLSPSSLNRSNVSASANTTGE
jgi:hypothetical protein